MQNLNVINSYHNEVIHDISFDWYSRRIATCSSDQKIKIWDKNLESGKWVKSADFNAHDGPIWKVKWAHPDFGTLIASCSFDKTVIIWEEKKPFQPHLPDKDNESQNYEWVEKDKLLQSKDSVEDIKFAPKFCGLKIIAASKEGICRIYEVKDLLQLGSWHMEHAFTVSSGSINAVSWNKNPFTPQMIALGCSSGQDHQAQSPLANILKQSQSTLDVTKADLAQLQLQHIPLDQQQDIITSATGTNCDTDGLSPNKSLELQIQKNQLIKQSQAQTLSIYILRENWGLLRNLEQISEAGSFKHLGDVNDVSWASSNGRSTDLLASCGVDGIYVWNLKYDKQKNDFNIIDVQKLANTKTWKVSWNIMASILASNNESNSVQVWKNDGLGLGNWKCVSEINEEEQLDSNRSQDNH